MDQSQIDNLARTWIAKVEALIKNSLEPGSIEDIPNYDLEEMVDNDPENAWLVIDSARGMAQDDLMLANIAAGPLEDLLWLHGEKFIDRFEELAKKDEHFAFLMTGVWARNKSGDIVARINAISNFTKRHL
ncbi:MAG: DUF6869 domain-containing protein [Alphaproteobacteria bacterium]